MAYKQTQKYHGTVNSIVVALCLFAAVDNTVAIVSLIYSFQSKKPKKGFSRIIILCIGYMIL